LARRLITGIPAPARKKKSPLLRKPELLVKLRHPAAAVNKFLLPREIRMAFGTNFNLDFFLCGAGFYNLAAGASDDSRLIFRVNTLFHNHSPPFRELIFRRRFGDNTDARRVGDFYFRRRPLHPAGTQAPCAGVNPARRAVHHRPYLLYVGLESPVGSSVRVRKPNPESHPFAANTAFRHNYTPLSVFKSRAFPKSPYLSLSNMIPVMLCKGACFTTPPILNATMGIP
jgi:hypothetical protein